MSTGYFADNGDFEEYFPDAESGLEAAQEYVSSGEWGEQSKTFWVSVRTWKIDIDGEEIEEETHKITMEPEEPECVETENHDWKSSGVYGHGGGVTERCVCRHCCAIRISDSWDHDPVDGEQGLRSTEYK